MKEVTVSFAGQLDAEIQERQAIRAAVEELLASVHCSSVDAISVCVSYSRDASSWAAMPAGGNSFALAMSASHGDLPDDADVGRLALHSSLSVLLAKVHAREPLFFLCSAGDASAEESRPTTPQHPVASPDELELKGEFVVEAPKFTREQWIVSEAVAKQFDDAMGIIRHQRKVFEEWGFARVDPNPRAVVCFYGKPGTGKSMAAHVMAAELGKKLICAKYSQIESKYVGDAPKKLRAVFETAGENDAVLFFDEADSFLGKRIENVSSGSDQAINSLRGEMLILLEDFKGVVVFASNLITNFDRAFESRILTKIEFELPCKEARKRIIQAKIPAEAPLCAGFGDEQLDTLAEISEGFSGRTIRNAMLMAFVKGARRSAEAGADEIRFEDFKEAFDEQKAAISALDALRDGVQVGKTVKIDDAGKEALQPLIEESLNNS